MKSLRVGIVGYGYMGKIRERELQKFPNVTLVGIADPHLDTPYKDHHALLEQGVDAVFVCTPNAYAPAIVIDCLNAKKHVFCEKPPGRNLQDIQAICAAEKKWGTGKIMFGFNHRYHPAMQMAKTLIEEKTLGRILSLRGVYGKSGGAHYLDSWRNDTRISGGGILLDQGIHMLDLFRFYVGDFSEYQGMLSTLFWDAPCEDNAFVLLRNPQGQTAMLHSTANAWKHTFELMITLEKGYIKIQGLLSKSGSYGREQLTYAEREFDHPTAAGIPAEKTIYFDTDLSWEKEMTHFLNAVSHQLPIEYATSEDALKVMEIIAHLYQREKVAAYTAQTA